MYLRKNGQIIENFNIDGITNSNKMSPYMMIGGGILILTVIALLKFVFKVF
jgi:hypothetical protein